MRKLTLLFCILLLPLLANAEDMNGKLFAAVKAGDVTAVQEALQEGADVNAGNSEDDNQTALHYAVASWKPDVVSLLIQKGANVNACAFENTTTPLMIAAISHAPREVFEILIENGADVNAAYQSPSMTQHVRELIREEVIDPANIPNPEDIRASALYFELLVGNREMSKYLLDKGADGRAVLGYMKKSLMIYEAEGEESPIEMMQNAIDILNELGVK